MRRVFGRNLDRSTVDGFGVEWSKFDQSGVPEDQLRRHWDDYFHIFPWGDLPLNAVGFDAGCGSGRWARFVAERVGTLHCVDASEAALSVARRRLADRDNCRFHHASVDGMPLSDAGMDFGYSLGVLHHVPDTAAAVAACVAKLKPGAPFLLYLYYALENRPAWFRGLWRASDRVRRFVSQLPTRRKLLVADMISGSVYWPLARASRAAEALGLPVDNLPLSFYRKASFYTMRTDALDRFGTPLEQRFTAGQIESMMTAAGLCDIRFSDRAPFWCAVGKAVGKAGKKRAP
jgi:SAM-dependent methyltransferase